MKVMKWLVIIILVAGFFQWPLFPKISSRVQGKVIDKDTKQPIQGAKVQLIYLWAGSTKRIREPDQETLTDQKGKFKFDVKYLRGLADFYLKCEKKGYISLIPSYYERYGKDEKFLEITKLFTLEEGQIKHFAIELEKGGGIKGTIYKKEASGISPFSDISGFIGRNTNPDVNFLKDDADCYDIAHIKADENGKFEIDGIEPYDDYYIIFLKNGYKIPDIKGIKIEKNITESFEYVIDLTDQTGIEGYIKIGQDFASYGLVWMYKYNPYKTPLTENDSGVCNVSKNGYYFCKGLNPGTYILRISIHTEDGLKKTGEYMVEIISGSTKLFNINL
jgi:hypothetical protein